MTNRITGDRLVDWIRWLVEHRLISYAEAQTAMAGVIDVKREIINDLKRQNKPGR